MERDLGPFRRTAGDTWRCETDDDELISVALKLTAKIIAPEHRQLGPQKDMNHFQSFDFQGRAVSFRECVHDGWMMLCMMLWMWSRCLIDHVGLKMLMMDNQGRKCLKTATSY